MEQEKLKRLKEILTDLGSLAVGFSGGVDSTFLLSVAAEVLKDRVIAVTIADPVVPRREVEEAEAFCRERGIRQIVTKTDTMAEDSFRKNPPDRCYHCKRRLFTEVIRIAKENGIRHVAEASNVDDLGDYRPGLKAVDELMVKSPLREAELTKAEIRTLSKELGLPTWNKPSFACLASRFVYGEEITEEKLRWIESAEQFLTDLGFIEERVRLHQNLARIEVPGKDIEKIAAPEMRERIYEKFRELGFTYITLDLKGYRTGSMNDVLVNA